MTTWTQGRGGRCCLVRGPWPGSLDSQLRVAATNGDLVREDGVEADGCDGLACVDQDVLLAHVL